MARDGGCYCGAVRFETEGAPVFQGQCHCRECQYAAGGQANLFVGMPDAGFKWTKGKPKGFARTDIENPVTRFFCGECGTHLLTESPGVPGMKLLKIGVYDDPAFFQPQMAIFLVDKQPFHHVPEGIGTFERAPG